MEAIRPIVKEKFIYLEDEKYLIKGVTYGTFEKNECGYLFPPPPVVEKDFSAMKEAGINTIRVYTAPPEYLLEAVERCGIRLIVGVYWGEKSCVFDRPKALREIREEISEVVDRCKKYPNAILAYCIGNEISPLIIRWYGRKKVENFLYQLYWDVKEKDPQGIVTYGNYPPTEYLQMDFLDAICFNLYILKEKEFRNYLARLQILSGDKPLFVGEMGDDTYRKGEKSQAEILQWKIQTVFEKGLCGAVVFSWTDEWVVGGNKIEDWKFGIMDENRRPKTSFQVVKKLYSQDLYGLNGMQWPRVSVVVPAYNGAATLVECLSSLQSLNYPDKEIIVINDGSTDETAAIAQRYAVKLINQPNLGLSSARNAGINASTGKLVAFTDSDCRVDNDWLYYAVSTMQGEDYTAVGGPNFTPPEDGWLAQCIALSPGNPCHVLLHNEEAEHIPGCNMIFKKEALEKIGGFDPVFSKAGDDVDVCWKLRDAGYRIGFSPSAVVWHHRRPSIKSYFKQQRGYGEAEAILEKKHPKKFNSLGFTKWEGRIYSPSKEIFHLLWKPKIYYGLFGTGMFQTIYRPFLYEYSQIPLTFEWYLVWTVFFFLSLFIGDFLPLALAAFGATLYKCLAIGLSLGKEKSRESHISLKKSLTIAFLHFLQPVGRAGGRIQAQWKNYTAESQGHPPTQPLKLKDILSLLWKKRKQLAYWGADGDLRQYLIKDLAQLLKERGCQSMVGTEWNNWDLRAQRNPLVKAEVYTVLEELSLGQTLRLGYEVHSTKLGIGLQILSTLIFILGINSTIHWWPLAFLPIYVFYQLIHEKIHLGQIILNSMESLVKSKGLFPLSEGI